MKEENKFRWDSTAGEVIAFILYVAGLALVYVIIDILSR